MCLLDSEDAHICSKWSQAGFWGYGAQLCESVKKTHMYIKERYTKSFKIRLKRGGKNKKMIICICLVNDRSK